MSTKTCDKCGSRFLILLRSQNLKVCNRCGNRIPWLLDEGQQPLITNNRDKDKVEHDGK